MTFLLPREKEGGKKSPFKLGACMCVISVMTVFLELENDDLFLTQLILLAKIYCSSITLECQRKHNYSNLLKSLIHCIKLGL